MHNERMKATGLVTIMRPQGLDVNEKRGNSGMNNEVLGYGHNMTGTAVRLAVHNWAFSQGLTIMSYDWRSDIWFMSDGEPYTTTIILREAGADESDAV